MLFARQGPWCTQAWATTIADVATGQLLDVITGWSAVGACRWFSARPTCASCATSCWPRRPCKPLSVASTGYRGHGGDVVAAGSMLDGQPLPESTDLLAKGGLSGLHRECRRETPGIPPKRGGTGIPPKRGGIPYEEGDARDTTEVRPRVP